MLILPCKPKKLINALFTKGYKTYLILIVKKAIKKNRTYSVPLLPFIHFTLEIFHTLMDEAIIRALLLPHSIRYENIQIHYTLNPKKTNCITITPIEGILNNSLKYNQLRIAIKEVLLAHNVYLLPNHYEKVHWVYQYIIHHCTYTDTSSLNNAWSAFFEGKTQCYGYTILSQFFLDSLHIPNCLIGGKVTRSSSSLPELHSWNLVRLGTKWYHFDACFGSTSPVALQEAYFLCGSDDLVSHTNWVARYRLFPISSVCYNASLSKRRNG